MAFSFSVIQFLDFLCLKENFPLKQNQLTDNYSCGLDRKYRVLVSVVFLSVCLSVSTITQKINGLGS